MFTEKEIFVQDTVVGLQDQVLKVLLLSLQTIFQYTELLILGLYIVVHHPVTVQFYVMVRLMFLRIL